MVTSLRDVDINLYKFKCFVVFLLERKVGIRTRGGGHKD